MISKQKNTERIERKQQKIDAGLLSDRYSGVSSIVIIMNYYQKGSAQTFMQRTVNFSPKSSAYFLMECMKHDCTNGGFDLESVIAKMVKGRLKSKNGELACQGNNASGHTRIDYKVNIQYNNTAR
ncbi:MAG: hypothetical protein HY755_12290 [Nitrospirae bacterium]|nr:hypothetical protein [Nitrospirota bacterium]